MSYIKSTNMADPKKEYNLFFSVLSGGLNVWELDHRLESDESPSIRNLRWRDGILSSRDGQIFVNDTALGVGHSAYRDVWNEHIFAHIGTKIIAFSQEDGSTTEVYSGGNDFTVKGTFFTYNDKLYYKTRGYYVEITATIVSSEYVFTAVSVTASPYTPTTYLNCDPASGAGDAYQPENRLSSKKTLSYTASFTVNVMASVATLYPSVEGVVWKAKVKENGVYVFSFDGTDWKLDNTAVNILDYGISIGGAATNGDTITVTSQETDMYYLPIKPVDDITEVKVDGVTLIPESYTITATSPLVATLDKIAWAHKVPTPGTYVFTYYLTEGEWLLGEDIANISEYGITVTGTLRNLDTVTVTYVSGDYSKDAENGVVFFRVPPPAVVPAIANTVEITYSKANATALNNIMDCRYVEVYGGTGALCIVMAGSKTQPNAYFWNGQTAIIVDPSYFPMEQYQLAGDTNDPITGFGKQQSSLVIFKERSVGRTEMTTESINDRLYISLPYVPINAMIGCDLPWTIQLIENNLVWCNSKEGVHMLLNTSAAYENNIECISKKVNGSSSHATLLYDIRLDDSDVICSADDDFKYMLCMSNGHVYVWDYSISTYRDPSWFLFTNIGARAFIHNKDDTWHIDAEGRLTHFENVFSDYGDGIDKVFQFATQNFGSYEALKNVDKVLINMRSDTLSTTKLEYITDYETRKDLTDLATDVWRLYPRDLSKRNLAGCGFANVFCRRPMCRRVRHFTMRLSNNNAGEDMSIVSAQIFYNYQGRQR